MFIIQEDETNFQVLLIPDNAAGVKETGGRVITTEILPEMCKIAPEDFREAGVVDIIELREGDALTILRNYSDNIDMLVLDG